MTEQLAFEDPFRDAARVDDHHRARRAARHGVERAGDDPFAGAVLAENHDVRVRGPDARNHLKDVLHGGRFRHELGHALAAQQGILRLEALAFAQRLTQLNLGTDDRKQPRVVPRFLHEVAGTAPHRFDRHLDAAPGRHHDDRKCGVDSLDPGQQVEPFFARRRVARVIQIDQRDVELAGLNRSEHASR